MRRRPLVLLLVCSVFFFFPAEWFLEWSVQRRSALHLSIGQFLLSDINAFVFSVVLPLLLMVGLFRVTRWGWYSLICFVLVWGARDAHFFSRFQAGGDIGAWGHLLIFAFSLIYFIHPRVRTLYFDPRLQWWKSKPRFSTFLPALCFDGLKWDYPILSNISDGGCFLQTPRLMDLEKEVTVAIPLPEPFGVSLLKAQGKVCWVSKSEKNLGVGIQFTQMEKGHRQALSKFVKANA